MSKKMTFIRPRAQVPWVNGITQPSPRARTLARTQTRPSLATSTTKDADPGQGRDPVRVLVVAIGDDTPSIGR